MLNNVKIFYIDNILITGNRIYDIDNTIKSAWIIDENKNKIWVSDIPNFIRCIKLKKLINKINVRY